MHESGYGPKRRSPRREVMSEIEGARSTGQCNTACSLSAGVWKPKVFRGR